MSWEIEAAKGTWKWMCKNLGRPLAALIVLAGCFIYFTNKFSENIDLHSRSKSFLIQMKAAEIHKIDSARNENKEHFNKLESTVDFLIMNVPIWISRSESNVKNDMADQIIFMVDNWNIGKKAIIDEIHLFKNTTKRDTINYKIGVEKK
jgi:replicative DNA helicase